MYMRRGYNSDRISQFIFGGGIPVTMTLIVVNVITFLAVTFSQQLNSLFSAYVSFDTVSLIAMPWKMFTYPLIGVGSPLTLFFQGYWLYWAGGSLERAWGSTRFAGFFFIMSAISALGVFVGGMLTGQMASLTGLWLPIAGVTMAFAMLNPEQQILFFFLFPLKLKYLALLDVAVILWSFGRNNPLMGILALAGCAFSYWYVRKGSRAYYSAPRRQQTEVVRVYNKPSLFSRLNFFKWYKEYREQKRLKDFFKKSNYGE